MPSSRRVVSVVLLALLSACSDEAPARGPKKSLPVPASADPSPRDAPARRSADDGGDDGADGAPASARRAPTGEGRVSCPGGTEHQGAPPPHGRRSFCQRRTEDGGVPHGPYREWSPDGAVLSDGAFADGERTGVWTEYYPDGTTKATTSYEAGVRDGPWKTWHENGAPSGEGSYRDGQKEGRATFWYPDGTKKAEGTWEADVKEGLSTNWAPDGSLQSKGNYVAGNKNGTWIDVDADGSEVTSEWNAGVRVDD